MVIAKSNRYCSLPSTTIVDAVIQAAQADAQPGDDRVSDDGGQQSRRPGTPSVVADGCQVAAEQTSGTS